MPRFFQNLKTGIATRFELQADGQRLLPMEGLRGVGAILVFFVHFWALFGSRSLGTPAERAFLFLGTLGHCGVDLFFALSAFIIYGMLLKKPVHYLDFVQRRIVRLYPAFVFVFIFYVGVSLSFASYSKIPAGGQSAFLYLLANFLMLPGMFPIVPLITVAWSLSYELSFYLVMPLLFRVLNLPAWTSRARILFFLAVAAGWLSLSTAGWVGHARLIMFVCGLLLRETISLRFSWPRFGEFAAAGSFVGALLLAGIHGEPALTQFCGPVIGNSAFGLILLFLSTWMLGYFSFAVDGWLAKGLSWDWLRWFGNFSYSYYLIHGAVLHFLFVIARLLHLPERLSPVAFTLFCVVSFAITAIIAAVMFLAIEKRFSFRTAAARRSVARSPVPA